MSGKRIEVIFYQEEPNRVPAVEWLADQPEKVQDKFDWLIDLLEQEGSNLRRPHAAPLRDRVYELRVRHQQVNYRLLYFLYGRTVAILTHGCTKEAEVEDADINRAILRMARFLQDPNAHTYRE